MNEIKDITKWCYCNLDLIEENKENNKKSIILIAGASSSGKSYASNYLKQFLLNKGINAVIISTDDYNKGIAKNVFQIVNKKYYNGSIKNEQEIVENIKIITKNTDFNEKFCKNNLILIKNAIKKYIDVDVNKFLKQLAFEFQNINFDKKDIYDLSELSTDLLSLLKGEKIVEKNYSKKISERNEQQKYINGKDIDVVVVEGIYALDNDLTKQLNDCCVIKNFVNCKDIYLFLRRMIRDKSITDCKRTFIFKNYIDYVAPAYKKDILPNKQSADFVFENNMTFDELRQGDVEIQTKYEIDGHTLKTILNYFKVIEKSYQQDTYVGDINGELLRLRETSNDGINFQLFSLVYKGERKVRHDKKLMRPKQVILSKNDFEELGLSKSQIINKFQELGLKIVKTLKKQRYIVMYKNQKLKIDFVMNKIYLESDDIKSENFYALLKNIIDEKNLKPVDSYPQIGKINDVSVEF